MSEAKFSDEIRAMAAIEGTLTPLDEEVRGRVLRWAAERYNMAPSLLREAPGPGKSRLGGDGTGGDSEGGGDKAKTGPAARYETFAEFFAAAAPTTDSDRVLVAAYWFTEREGWVDLQSRPLNKELRDLGYAVNHMPSAFEALTERRPQPVVQLRKTGKTKQAPVRYKLTAEGKAAVERMLSDG